MDTMSSFICVILKLLILNKGVGFMEAFRKFIRKNRLTFFIGNFIAAIFIVAIADLVFGSQPTIIQTVVYAVVIATAFSIFYKPDQKDK